MKRIILNFLVYQEMITFIILLLKKKQMRNIIKAVILVSTLMPVFVNAKTIKATQYIENMYNHNDDSLLFYDETEDNNLRFRRQEKNIVNFNDEEWVIIGVFNNVDNGTGKKEKRIKLIRKNPIGEYSFTTTNKWGDLSKSYNDSDIMKLLNLGYENNQGLINNECLFTSSNSQNASNHICNEELGISKVNNSLYYNRRKGICYDGGTNDSTECDFTSSGLKEEDKELISNAVWYTTRIGYYPQEDNYERERMGDDILTWTGVVGLPNLSDAFFAPDLMEWKGYALTPQVNKEDWFTTCPSSNSDQCPKWYSSYPKGEIYPVVYLNEDIRIEAGDGTESNPLLLSLRIDELKNQINNNPTTASPIFLITVVIITIPFLMITRRKKSPS